MAASRGRRPTSWTRCALPSPPDPAGPHPERARGKLYGRRKGRALKPLQRIAVETSLPRLAVPLDGAPGSLDPGTLFEPRPEAVWLEIGFGAGEHLLAQAEAHPSIGIIGCEAFEEGIGKLIRAVEVQRIGNVRVHPGDARLVIDALADASVGRVFLLFPDPWPKARHHKRRFISRETLDALARVMAPGAELRVATDSPDYVRWTLLHILHHPAFDWPATSARDWRQRAADWPETRYERKAHAAGRPCFYLRFLRL